MLPTHTTFTHASCRALLAAAAFPLPPVPACTTTHLALLYAPRLLPPAFYLPLVGAAVPRLPRFTGSFSALPGNAALYRCAACCAAATGAAPLRFAPRVLPVAACRLLVPAARYLVPLRALRVPHRARPPRPHRRGLPAYRGARLPSAAPVSYSACHFPCCMCLPSGLARLRYVARSRHSSPTPRNNCALLALLIPSSYDIQRDA